MAMSGTKLKLHKSHCAICKHRDCKEIEEAYLDGVSPYQIELDWPGISNHSVYKHAKALGLDSKRDNSTLTKVRRILDRANVGKMKLSEALVGKCLELEAKITGEVVERRKVEHEGEIKHKIDIEKSVKRRFDRLVDAVPGLDSGNNDGDTSE